MAILHVKSPNGTQTNVDLSKLVLTNNDQTINGVKTFNEKINIGTDGASIAGFKYDNYGDTSGDEFDQLMIVSQGMGNLDSPGAKIALHSYKEGTSADGSFTIRGCDGTSYADLQGYPDGRLNINHCTAGGSVTSNAVETTITSGTGYIAYKSGLKIQWGIGRTGDFPVGNVYFPIAFTQPPSIKINAAGDTSQSLAPLIRTQDGLTEFTVLVNGSDNTNKPGVGFYWIAVGV